MSLGFKAWHSGHKVLDLSLEDEALGFLSG